MSEDRAAVVLAVTSAVEEARAIARSMTPDDCRLVSAAEGWPAVIVAYHIGLGLRRQAGFIARALTAEAPFVFEWEPTHEINAVNAREHASLSAADAADEIAEGWSRLGAVLGRMGEADWAREVPPGRPQRKPGARVMTFAERVLYHQIHPVKVFTDVATAVIAIDLFWRHLLVPGLVIAILPPVLVSATLIREVDLESYRRSAMGAYLRRFMPLWVQALRLFGVAFKFHAAWYNVPACIFGAIGLIGACWANGIVRRAPAH